MSWGKSPVLPAGLIIGIAALAGSSAARAETAVNLDTFTVWATRTLDRVVDTLGGASAVTREQIDQGQAASISEVLRSVPGVEVMETGQDPASAISIRGLQDFGRVNVMIEGARQNFQTSGHSADGVFYLDPEVVERVDVTRGPVSVIYGSGAIGGVVNFQLRSPDSFLMPGETWASQLSGRYNSNNEGITMSGIAAARPTDTIGMLGNIVWRDSNDYRDGNGNRFTNSAQEIVNAVGRVVATPNDAHEIDFSYLYQNQDFVSGSGTRQRATEIVDSTAALKWLFNPAENAWVDARVSTYVTQTGADQTRLSNGAERSFKITTTGIDAANTSRFSTGSVAHQVTYGGDYFLDDVTTFDQENAGGPNPFTPSGERSVYGLFVQDEVQVTDWLELIGALRYDSYSLKGGSVNSDGSRISPKITAGVTVMPGVQFFATYAEGYRAPAVTESLISGLHPGGFAFTFLPNPNLKPETAHNLEGGVNISFDDVFQAADVFRAKATVFQNKVDNFIEGVFTPGVPPPFGSFQYQNIANATLHGVELEAAYDAGKVFGDVSFAAIRGENDANGQHLASAPPDKLAATLGFRQLDERLVFGGTVTHYWSQNRVPPGGFTSNSYTLVDLFANYKHNENVTVNLALKNLFDTFYLPYLANVPASSPVPGAGFSFRVGANVRLGG